MIQLPAIVQLPGAMPGGEAFSQDIVQMILHAGLMVKFVLLVLLFFSVVTWTIIFFKLRFLRRAHRESEFFVNQFWDSRDWKSLYQTCRELKYGPIPNLFATGYAEFSRIRRIEISLNLKDNPHSGSKDQETRSQKAVMDNLGRALRKAVIDQTDRLERALSFLATTGNTAPFIGLFGTVWGIMESFRGIGLRGSANLAVVAPGISEALIATAAGLAAAIPAVVAFNYFVHRVAALRAEMDIFTSDFLIMVERQLFKRRAISQSES